MKKIILACISFILVLFICGCNPVEPSQTQTQTQTETQAETETSRTYSEELTLNDMLFNIDRGMAAKLYDDLFIYCDSKSFCMYNLKTGNKQVIDVSFDNNFYILDFWYNNNNLFYMGEKEDSTKIYSIDENLEIKEEYDFGDNIRPSAYIRQFDNKAYLSIAGKYFCYNEDLKKLEELPYLNGVYNFYIIKSNVIYTKDDGVYIKSFDEETAVKVFDKDGIIMAARGDFIYVDTIVDGYYKISYDSKIIQPFTIPYMCRPAFSKSETYFLSDSSEATIPVDLYYYNETENYILDMQFDGQDLNYKPKNPEYTDYTIASVSDIITNGKDSYAIIPTGYEYILYKFESYEDFSKENPEIIVIGKDNSDNK